MSLRHKRRWREASGLFGEYWYKVVYGSSRKPKRLPFNFKTKRDATEAARTVGGRVITEMGRYASIFPRKRRVSRHVRTR